MRHIHLREFVQTWGFKALFEVSYDITEALRAGDMEQAKVMWPGVQACYARVDNALNQLEQ